MNYFKNNLNNIDYEVIIINDFSNDDTLIVGERLFKNYKNFKIFDNTIKGLGGAINLGISKSVGTKIAVIFKILTKFIE